MLNKCMLIGNLGADPEIHQTQDGKAVVNIRMATSESWKDKNTGERRERTEWHRVMIFNEELCKIAEQYLCKGSKILVEGKLQTHKWQDQQGNDRYTREVVLSGFDSKLLMLISKGSSIPPNTERPKGPEPQTQGMHTDPDDEIPF